MSMSMSMSKSMSMTTTHAPLRDSERGFTLVEMIVVTLLLLIAMLGLLAVFDASARINKSETDVADAQGAVRYGIYQMTSAIRMAGAGGLFVTQAVLNSKGSGMLGITIGSGNSYNNVAAGTKVTDSTGTDILVRPGTDMIEIRGVIRSPLLGFDHQSGCSAGCVTSGETPGSSRPGIHHDRADGQRRRLAASAIRAIDAYTASITGPQIDVRIMGKARGSAWAVPIPTPGRPALPAGAPKRRAVEGPPLSTPGVSTAGARVLPRRCCRLHRRPGRRYNAGVPSDGAPPPADPDRKSAGGADGRRLSFIAMLPPPDPAACTIPGPGFAADRSVTPLADDVEDLQTATGKVALNGDTRTRTARRTTYDTDQNHSHGRPTGGAQRSGETPFIDRVPVRAHPLGRQRAARAPARACTRDAVATRKAHDLIQCPPRPATSMDVPSPPGPITAVRPVPVPGQTFGSIAIRVPGMTFPR
jgi:prepilin-type N-terminal cleavage/methylation domain-containing protein